MAIVDEFFQIGDLNGGAGVNSNNPDGGDSRQDGDNNMRAIQSVVRNSFPNFAGTKAAPSPVQATEAEINTLVGINTANKADAFPSGTKLVFYQNIPPTGWVIESALDEHTVRMTRGTDVPSGGDPGSVQGGTSGGTYDFSVLFDLKGEGVVPGVGDHLLTGPESGEKGHNHGSHRHRVKSGYGGGASGNRSWITVTTQSNVGDGEIFTDSDAIGPLVENTAISVIPAANASEAHGHSVDLRAKWAACIVATKS